MQFNDINYAIGSSLLFEKLNFTLSMGMIIGLVGMNGSGKSTLLKMMSGLCEPDSGRITFDNHLLYGSRALQSQIGYVPSVPMLFPFLTVQENLLWISEQRELSKQRHRDIIRQFELTGFQKVLFGNLSDGLKKRVCIASAFLHQPPLLILDEPCAGLDPTQRQQLWDSLRHYRSPDRLIIVSSHHPEELATFCDDMVLLSQGKLLRYPSSSTSSFAKNLWDTITNHPLTETETAV